MAIYVKVCITSLILWHLIPHPLQNIVEIHSTAEQCAKNCDHKVQQPHTTTKLQWISPHKSHYQHTVMPTHGLAKTFGRFLGSYLLNSPHSMSKAIKCFVYTLDILWVKLQGILLRFNIVSLSTYGPINTLRTGLLNCLNARSQGLTFRHRASCI